MTTVKIEASWQGELQEEFEKPYFQLLIEKLKNVKSAQKTIYPPGPLIFNAFNQTSFSNVKVVILGQDPYHGLGEAMGLSFSVPPGVRIPPSLHNIFKELKRDLNINPPSSGDLSKWANQGVLLLNASLTVEANQANSHKDIGWHIFTNRVIEILSTKRQHLVFMLWGNFAKSKKVIIDDHRHLILESAHPSPLAGNAFQGCSHFSKANTYLVAHNIQPIDWQLS